MRRRILAIKDLKIEVLESDGGGSPIFFCHHNSGAASSFKDLFTSEIGKRRKMIAFSLPGHGGSTRANVPAEQYCIASLGKIAADVVQSYGSADYWLVGHSLGGHAILEALSAFPRASGLMLVSCPPLSLSNLVRAFKPDPSAGALFKGELTNAQLNQLVSCFIDPRHEAAWQIVRDNIMQTDPHFRPALAASLQAGKIRNEIEAFECATMPIAMVAGTDDRFLNLEYVSAHRGDRLWRKQVIFCNASGHVPHLEVPGLFSQILEEFLQDTKDINKIRAPELNRVLS